MNHKTCDSIDTHEASIICPPGTCAFTGTLSKYCKPVALYNTAVTITPLSKYATNFQLQNMDTKLDFTVITIQLYKSITNSHNRIRTNNNFREVHQVKPQ